MKPFSVILVKPHPPLEIFNRGCPVPENYRYNWEPIVLKLFAHLLEKHFGEKIETEIWHLLNPDDDIDFLKHVQQKKPAFVIFTETDTLVNEVNRLSALIKKISPTTATVVGGKQTTLLNPGDHFPFTNIDFAIKGDGGHSLILLIEQCINQQIPELDGLIIINEQGMVSKANQSPLNLQPLFDLEAIHLYTVYNHTVEEYFNQHQSFPCIIKGIVKTSPILTGIGCRHHCSFCQSSLEYKNEKTVLPFLFDPKVIAATICSLNKTYGVNNFFSLEPNIDMENLLRVYAELEKFDIDYMPVSGFVRAADIVKINEKGLLKQLTAKGVRVFSVGLDIPVGNEKDIYYKNFSFDEMLNCLAICRENGIIVCGTIVGDPFSTREEFAEQLRLVSKLPVAEIDIRLAVALRNTSYYQLVESYLLYHPNHSKIYFDRQNYRYQTIQIPGKITPEETYFEVNNFYQNYHFSNEYRKYVKEMMHDFPDTRIYFERQK
jgi:radical SAM superfamily enzyme YgiQ (UPF0313 family)